MSLIFDIKCAWALFEILWGFFFRSHAYKHYTMKTQNKARGPTAALLIWIWIWIWNPARWTVRLWNKVNLDNLKKDVNKLSDCFLKTYTPTDHINVLWDSIRNILMTAMDIHVRTKLSSSKSWITSQTRRLLRQKQRWFNKAKQSNSDRHWRKYREIKKKTTSKSMIQSMSKTLSRTIKTIKKLKSGHTLIHAYISKNIFPRVW